MYPIRMIMFDLSGTTIKDDTAVQDCLCAAAGEHGLDTTPEELARHLGMNKIHLYQFLIARSQGKTQDIRTFDPRLVPETKDPAEAIFHRFEERMMDHYRSGVQPMPGAEETFQWCHNHNIKVATDTGFHGNITDAIMEGTGWRRNGLVDASVHVESIPGQRGRPSPYMIFHAMERLDIVSVHQVIKVGDTPADMLEGRNAGCAGIVGVLSGAQPVESWGACRHTHVIPSVKELPELVMAEFVI